MKHQIKIYLTTEQKGKLLQKASEVGIEGRGALTRYLERLADEDIVLLDTNLKKVLKHLVLK